jgi:hypothetical protein
MLVSDCVALRLLLLGLVVTWLVTGFPGLTTKVGRVWSTSDCHCGRGLPPAFTGRRAVLDRRPRASLFGVAPRRGCLDLHQADAAQVAWSAVRLNSQEPVGAMSAGTCAGHAENQVEHAPDQHAETRPGDDVQWEVRAEVQAR